MAAWLSDEVFTVTMLLRRVRRSDGLSPDDQNALDKAIADLERRYFANVNGNGNGEIDLRILAEDWVGRVK